MKNYLLMAVAVILSSTALAQQNNDGEIIISKMILPDGKELKSGMLDSLKNAWGEDRVLFHRKSEESQKGIIYLIRKTDEDFKKEEADSKALNALVGLAAPQFELTDLQGKKWSLNALRGKVVVLNFWFTACAPCIREIPELNKLTEQYKGKDVVFLGLAPDKAEKINTFLQKRDFKYTILPDSYEVSQSFKISNWPTSMVIDGQGTIRFIQITGEDIANRLASAINNAL
jgi:peroxiredoxin